MTPPSEALAGLVALLAEIEAFDDYPDGLRLSDTDWADRITVGHLRAIIRAFEALEPFAKIPLCYARRGSQPQVAELDTPAPGGAYTAADVVRARKLIR